MENSRKSKITASLWCLFLHLSLLASCMMADTRIHWIFMTYHKTGTVVARRIKAVIGLYCTAHVADLELCPKDFTTVRQVVYNNDLNHLSSCDMEVDWQKELGSDPNHVFRVLHFVRDPFEMVMSGYLYHLQVPPVETLGFSDSLCHASYHNTPQIIKDYYTSKFAEYFDLDRPQLESQIDSLVELCENLFRVYYQAGESDLYTNVLNRVSAMHGVEHHIDGARFEAVRGMLNGILKMGTNALHQKSGPPGMAFAISTDELITSDPVELMVPMRKITDFLTAPVEGTSSPFYSKLVYEDMDVTWEFTAALLHPDFDQKEHHTKHSMELEERDDYIRQLKADPVLGPLLSVVKRCVQEVAAIP